MTIVLSQQKFGKHQIDLIKNTLMVAKDAQPPSDDELGLFLAICDRMALDPCAKQIYPVFRKGKWTVQIGIDGLRAIADRTGQYAGSDEPLFDEGLSVFEFEHSGRKLPTVCKVTVWKIVSGVRCPFVGVARYSEFVQTFQGKVAKTWDEMPLNQLAKCAESQALRKAFPQCNSAPPDSAPPDFPPDFIEANVVPIEASVSLSLSKEQHEELERLRKHHGITSDQYRQFIISRYGVSRNSEIPAYCFEELVRLISEETPSV